MDIKKYNTKITNLACFRELFKSVLAMIVEGRNEAFIQQCLNINKETISLFRKISSKNHNDLIEALFECEAITLHVNSSMALNVLRAVNQMCDSQVTILVANNRPSKNDYRKYLHPIYKKYIEYIAEAISTSINTEGNNGLPGVSNQLMTEFMEVKAAHVLAIELSFAKFNIFHFQVDEKILRTSLISHSAKIEERDLVFALIKSGSNHPFIADNVKSSISLKYFKKWRNIFSVNKEKESVSVGLGADIYNDYLSMMANHHANIDAYMTLHRTYKLRIDTLYVYINSVLECIDEDELIEIRKVNH